MDLGNLSVKNDMKGKNDMTRKWKDMKGKDMKATAKAWMDRLAQELKEKERWKAITFWREENKLHEVMEQCFCFIDMLWYIQHRWSFCCLHIYSFNALPQAPLYSSIKRGGLELPWGWSGLMRLLWDHDLGNLPTSITWKDADSRLDLETCSTEGLATKKNSSWIWDGFGKSFR